MQELGVEITENLIIDEDFNVISAYWHYVYPTGQIVDMDMSNDLDLEPDSLQTYGETHINEKYIKHYNDGYNAGYNI